jgi:hypothetical protein
VLEGHMDVEFRKLKKDASVQNLKHMILIMEATRTSISFFFLSSGI